MIEPGAGRAEWAVCVHEPRDLSYRPDIDGLRALAVLAVVLYHVGGFGLTGGFGGVDVFFVISGYLITTIIKREIETGTFSLVNFYERRIRRIFPALIAMAAVTTAVSALLLLPDDFKEFGKSLQGLATLSANYYFQRKTGYFDVAAYEKPLLHTWSLAVEEQFYIVFPLLLFLLYRTGRNAIVPALALVAAVSLAASVREIDAAPAQAFFSTLGRAWELLLGVLTAFAAASPPKSRLQCEMAAAGGMALIVFGYVAYSDATLFPGLAALVFCLGAALVIHAGEGGRQTLTSKLLSWRPLVGIGLISYSVYLWHWPLMVFLRYRYPDILSGAAEADIWLRAALVSACLAIGYLSWRFIERPFRRLAGTPAQRQAFAWFLGLTAASVALSIALIRTDGFPRRWPAEIVEMLKIRERPEHEVCMALPPSGPWPKDACRIGPETKPADTLVWGDSHAKMLIDPLAAASARSNRSVIVASLGGCPPLEGVTLYGRSKIVSCRLLTDTVFEAIKGSSIRRVVLAGRWAYYAEGLRYETEGGQPMQLAPEGIEKNPDVFSKLFQATVSRLAAMGLEVVIVGSVPEHKFYVAPVMAREVAWQQGLPPALPFGDFAMRQRHVLPLLKRVSELPRVRVLYPDREFCKDGVCVYEEAGQPLYSDTNHLTPAGLRKLAPLIDEIFSSPSQ